MGLAGRELVLDLADASRCEGGVVELVFWGRGALVGSCQVGAARTTKLARSPGAVPLGGFELEDAGLAVGMVGSGCDREPDRLAGRAFFELVVVNNVGAAGLVSPRGRADGSVVSRLITEVCSRQAQTGFRVDLRRGA